jgi:hypothetical protein
VGNAAALVQVDIKRILGYSSIANAGYVLTAILVHAKSPNVVSLTPVLFFMLGYAVTTLGSFAVLTLAVKDGKEVTRLSDLHGFWQRSPFAAGALVVFLASQIGIPPTAGFFGKLLIFKGTADAGMLWLGLVLAITSVLGAAYYLTIMRACFVSDQGAVKGTEGRSTAGLTTSLVACIAGVFLVSGFLPGLDSRTPLLETAKMPMPSFRPEDDWDNKQKAEAAARAAANDAPEGTPEQGGGGPAAGASAATAAVNPELLKGPDGKPLPGPPRAPDIRVLRRQQAEREAAERAKKEAEGQAAPGAEAPAEPAPAAAPEGQ